MHCKQKCIFNLIDIILIGFWSQKTLIEAKELLLIRKFVRRMKNIIRKKVRRSIKYWALLDKLFSIQLYSRYILGVESPLVCDIINSADENGFMSIDANSGSNVINAGEHSKAPRCDRILY